MRFIRNLLQRKAVQQFIKYVIVGCVVTAIDMAALHLCYRVLGVPIKAAVVIGFMCGNVSSFIFNKYFTFRNLAPTIIRQYAKYFITSITGLLWTLFLMTLFYEQLGLFAGITRYNYLLCKMIVAVLVMFWNFMIIRHWTLADYDLSPLPPLERFGKNIELYLSIIIPAYNERNRLPVTLEAVFAWLRKQAFSYEVIVIDDGSTDDMLANVTAQFCTHPAFRIYSLGHNQGKGAAVKAGMLMAKGEYRLFMDADHQIRIEELERFLPLAAGDRVIIGSKYAESAQTNEAQISASRVFVSRLGNFLIRFLLYLDVKDTQCGFKLFPAQVAETVFRLQRLRGFAFDVELLSLAQLFRIKIVELPITLNPASETRVRTLRDSLGVFVDLLRIKLNIWGRKYRVHELKAETGNGIKPLALP